MAYVGRKPADAALTADDLASGIVSADKLASNAVTIPLFKSSAVIAAFAGVLPM